MNFQCSVVAAPLRAEPNHRSEMVSQLLFGESVKKITENENWIKIIAEYDNYEGWVEKKSLQLVENISSEFRKKLLCNETKFKNAPTQHIIRLLPGSEFFVNNNNEIYFKNKILQPLESFDFIGVDELSSHFIADEILQTASLFLNTPYLWGGKSLFGIDCSGFTQTVFKLNKIKLPRDAYQQAELGVNIDFEQNKIGDLAFFKNENDKIIHVGICISHHQIIHCSISVRIDKLDEKGIWNEELKEYSHQLAFIKRIKQ